ncbi:hypothetical protein ACIO3S_24400 [Nocardioides sp. NPDC087217]|uniref:hypothetical protein n=1 Tax=Nocardioides sp. NPDC087217 TaxID=3364335 RepID=UPI0038083DE0
MATTPPHGSFTVAELQATVSASPRTPAPATLHRLARVRAANAGAGASTIALALADAADAGQLRTHLIDAAGPVWSGLSAASEVELGEAHGWRRGRRGKGMVIDRVARHAPNPDLIPLPRVITSSDLTVVDTGWTCRELDASSCWLVSAPADAEVVVTRAGAHALGQSEAVLAKLDAADALDRVLVVVTRAPRRLGPLYAAAGPLFRTLNERGAVHVAPRRVNGCGIGSEPSPGPMLTLGRALLRHIAVGASARGALRIESEGEAR